MYLLHQTKCCESQINILLFPVVDRTPLVIKSTTPPGWYSLFPPNSSRISPELCYIPPSPALNPYLGWGTKSMIDCDTPDRPNQGGRCKVFSGFVDDFTEAATVETNNLGVSDGVLIASGRHIQPKIIDDLDIISRQCLVILNPRPGTIDPLTGEILYTTDSILNCRIGKGIFRDQLNSHVGHDQVFGTFLNILLRITGNYKPARSIDQSTKNNQGLKTHFEDFIRITNPSAGVYSLSLAPEYQSCCDCPSNHYRLQISGVITGTSTGITLKDTGVNTAIGLIMIGTTVTINSTGSLIFKYNDILLN